LDELYIKNVRYNKEKSYIIANLVIALLVISLYTTIWYRKRLNDILSDILFLSSIQPTKKQHKIKTLEADAIMLRMRKKGGDTIDPSLLDPVTEILNHKGLVVMYSQRKNLKEGNFTSLSVLEIDNFSKSNRKYPQELTQAILKKIAYTLSLFEQPTDVVARTDYNQFTIILVRPTKEQCLKELEMIRQSISEIKIKLPDGENVNITISGGFNIKQNNKSLEDTIIVTKRILEYAKKTGGNKISQLSDLSGLDV
jgi:diguanylate cyclase (GGDEF)-like protein